MAQWAHTNNGTVLAPIEADLKLELEEVWLISPAG